MLIVIKVNNSLSTHTSVLSAYSCILLNYFIQGIKKKDIRYILMTEAVTVSNVIAIASLVSEIWLATERQTHTHTHTQTQFLS